MLKLNHSTRSHECNYRGFVTVIAVLLSTLNKQTYNKQLHFLNKYIFYTYVKWRRMGNGKKCSSVRIHLIYNSLWDSIQSTTVNMKTSLRCVDTTVQLKYEVLSRVCIVCENLRFSSRYCNNMKHMNSKNE
jgi:hypothetical protein